MALDNQFIKIKKFDEEAWVTVQVLTVAFGWVEVMDGDEPIWIAASQIHPYDRKRLAAGVIWSGSPRYRGTKLNRTQVELIVNAARQNDQAPDLRGVDLSLADLHGLDLNLADLRGVDLSEAILSGANLAGARLKGANLSEADLRGANLNQAGLRYANLSGAEYDDQTIWADDFDPVQAGAVKIP